MSKSFKRLITAMLATLMCFHFSSCSSNNPIGNISIDPPTETVVYEEKIIEEYLGADIISELTTKEIYIKELYAVESTVSEMLLGEEKIKEVIDTTSVYIPEEHIADFSEHSLTSSLFDKVELALILTKVAIGTGVILTLVAMKVAGIDGVVGSVVAAAAPEAIKGAATGLGVGTLIGGLTGAADGIDQSGRVSAIVCFSLAVVGVIVSAVSLAASIPTGGAAGAGVAIGVKIALAGIGLAGSVVGAGVSASDMVKAFTATDAEDIDWNNIDWNKIGEGAAIKAIQGAANGYLWGSIIGAIKGGAEGYDYYKKYSAAYSTYEQRIQHTPAADGGGRGHWTGDRGESTFVLDEPLELPDGTIVKQISYHNGCPDFTPYAKAEVNIPNMTSDRDLNFDQADEKLAEMWSKIKFQGKKWSAGDIEKYRRANRLTWHELNNLKTMQLVPTDVNLTWGHLGGVGEYNIFTSNGGFDFD